MPIRPKSIPLRCPQCHWRGSFQPKSDALLGSVTDRPCPRCGHTPVEMDNPPSSSFWGLRKHP